MPIAWPDEVFGGTAQPSAAKNQNDDDDQENEAEPAAANIEGIGKNRGEYEMHNVSFCLMGTFTILFLGNSYDSIRRRIIRFSGMNLAPLVLRILQDLDLLGRQQRRD